jgi:hypothetical protein
LGVSHISTCVRIFFLFFQRLSSLLFFIYLYLYVCVHICILFIHSSMRGHLGCFGLLASVNSRYWSCLSKGLYLHHLGPAFNLLMHREELLDPPVVIILRLSTWLHGYHDCRQCRSPLPALMIFFF